MQHKEQVISKSTKAEIVTQSTFQIPEDSTEFNGVLCYSFMRNTSSCTSAKLNL